MKIFVLTSTIADYEGSFHSAACAFTDEIYARIVALSLNDLLDDWVKNGKNLEEVDAIIEKIRLYEPELTYLSEDLSYSVDEIELITT